MEETPKESGQGHAEEQPAEVAGEGANPRREQAERDRDRPGEGEGGDDDGTATGNPRAAG